MILKNKINYSATIFLFEASMIIYGPNSII